MSARLRRQPLLQASGEPGFISQCTSCQRPVATSRSSAPVVDPHRHVGDLMPASGLDGQTLESPAQIG